MVLHLLLALSLICTPTFGESRQVLVMAEDQDSLIFEDYLDTHPESISFVDHYKETTGKKISIKNTFFQAQFQFLNGSLKKAKTKFEEVAEQALKKDWAKPQQKKIVYAMMRRAQLEKNHRHQKLWVQKTLEYAPHITPNADHFPPPIMKIWKSKKEQLKLLPTPLPFGSEKFSQVLVNGEQIEIVNGMTMLSPGEKRITLLSNRYHPLVLTLPSKNLETHKVTPQPFAQGNCQNPRRHSHKLAVYYSDRCILPPGENVTAAWTRSEEKPDVEHQRSDRKTSSWYNNRYLLIFGGAALTSLAIWQYNQSQNEPSPPTPTPVVKPTTTVISNNAKGSN